ncbi:MAG: hypothetical protein QW279_00725 [Candidatus Jordarchaeaceae archaeon]
MERRPIGKTTTVEKEPNTTSKLHFWLKEGEVVAPFDLVSIEHIKNTRTIGVITEIMSLSDANSHLTNYVSSEFGDPLSKPYVERMSATVAEVNVLRNTGTPEIVMPIPSDMSVYYATPDEIRLAVGTDKIKGTPIKVGAIKQTNGVQTAIDIDSDYLLGPEGAHINCSGISGLATKTSFLMFVLYSIIQSLKNEVAAVIFNVKQADLLSIDQLNENINEEDEMLYKLLGLEIRPFHNVKYILPRGSNGMKPDSDYIPDDYLTYAYALEDVYDKLDMLFADTPDPYFTLDTFTTKIREEWKNGRLIIEDSGGKSKQASAPRVIKTWDDLKAIENSLLQEVYNLHPTTCPRIKRELGRLTSHSLFVNRRSSKEVYLGDEIKKIKGGEIIVVDIARIPSRTQPFIVGDVMRSIEDAYRTAEKDFPKKLIIFLDELNSFVPSNSTNAISEQIVEIARKGRSRGIILFGAEQFKSEVNDQIIGNCSVHALGRTGSAEIRRNAYSFLDEQSKLSVMNLGKGEIVLSVPTWRNPVKIKFPKPTYKNRGK